jgi:hypothetical protein
MPLATARLATTSQRKRCTPLAGQFLQNGASGKLDLNVRWNQAIARHDLSFVLTTCHIFFQDYNGVESP